jgi:hypothetical protein
MKLIRVLVVPADDFGSDAYRGAAVRVETVPVELGVLRRLIGGGWLENVTAPGADWHAYCDEEGKLKKLPANFLATHIAQTLGWQHDDILCGDVIFLGDAPGGREADVPEYVLDLVGVH